jgi:hypothetical protein
MSTTDPRKARLAEIAAHRERRDRLTAEHGQPVAFPASDALALAMTALIPVDPAVTADDIYASVYRDEEAADAWLESNLTHYGHPALAKVPLPDGRFVGILDLRPALRREAAERDES